MAIFRGSHDAHGQGIWDFHHGKRGSEIVERDDGAVAPDGDPAVYFRTYKQRPPQERKALRLARGRALDVGCGAGRAALHLQDKGLDVLGIDNSPLAIKVCRLRGLRKVRLMSLTQLSRRVGVFDTILMLGNNFGLFGNVKRARWMLRRFAAMTTPGGRIICASRDPYGTDEPRHLRYHRRNRRRGRMGGQVRIRVRYLDYATPWFDLLLVSRDEMGRIVAGTGWAVSRFFDPKGAGYIAVLEKPHTRRARGSR